MTATGGVAPLRAGVSLPTLTSYRFLAAAIVAIYHAGMWPGTDSER